MELEDGLLGSPPSNIFVFCLVVIFSTVVSVSRRSVKRRIREEDVLRFVENVKPTRPDRRVAVSKEFDC